MAGKGRPPKPTALHVLNGNPSKLDLKKRETSEPKPEPVAPKKPTWLNKEGKKMWNRLVPELEKLGLFTVVDGEAFAAACQSWGIYVECQTFIDENGMTYEYTNKNGSKNRVERPELKIANKALGHFKSFSTEFGLTPASRTRIQVDTESDREDAMESLLSGVR